MHSSAVPGEQLIFLLIGIKVEFEENTEYSLIFETECPGAYQQIIVPGNILLQSNFFKFIADSTDDFSKIIIIDDSTITIRNNTFLEYKGAKMVFEFLSHNNLAIERSEIQLYLSHFLRAANYLNIPNVLKNFMHQSQWQYQLEVKDFILANYPYQLIYDLCCGDELNREEHTALFKIFIQYAPPENQSIIWKLGFKPKDLLDSRNPATISEVLRSGFPPAKLLDSCNVYTDDLGYAGCTLSEIINSGTIEDIFARKNTRRKVAEWDHKLRPFYWESQLNEINSSAKELVKAGCMLRQFKDTDITFTAKELRKEGVSAKILLHVGYKFKDIVDAGISARQLRQEGIDPWELHRDYDFSFDEVIKLGYKFSELNRMFGASTIRKEAQDIKPNEYLGEPEDFKELQKDPHSGCCLMM